MNPEKTEKQITVPNIQNVKQILRGGYSLKRRPVAKGAFGGCSKDERKKKSRAIK